MITVLATAEGPCNPPNPDPIYDSFPRSPNIVNRTRRRENGVPYFDIYREWMQTFDGTMEFVRHSRDSIHNELPSPSFRLRKLMSNTE
jgi:hypothetical protein